MFPNCFGVTLMRKIFLKYIFYLIFAGLCLFSHFTCEAAKWEPVKEERADSKTIVKETEFEIKTASSTIIITSNHSAKIQIFTILGRLVSSDTIPAGTSQLILPAHGIYLVKIGGITCKVAV